MMFNRNISNNLQVAIKNLWGVRNTQERNKYLGLLALVEKSRRQAFGEVKIKLWKKLQCQKKKFLSQNGKYILLKAMALVLSTYIMSCFKLLWSLCLTSENLMSNFQWGKRKEEHKIQWQSWEKMFKPKCKGGLQFKNLQNLNLALLAKQGR